MVSLGIANWLRLLLWLFVGMVIYFYYGRHHSRYRT
jgi:APA family basic amino acid/polyamine antiporter